MRKPITLRACLILTLSILLLYGTAVSAQTASGSGNNAAGAMGNGSHNTNATAPVSGLHDDGSTGNSAAVGAGSPNNDLGTANSMSTGTRYDSSPKRSGNNPDSTYDNSYKK